MGILTYEQKRRIGHDFSKEELAWVHAYSAGLQEFTEEQTERTLQCFKSGDATGTIAEGRMITAIAHHKSHLISRLSHRATAAGLMNNKKAEVVTLSAAAQLNVPERVTDAMQKARLLLYGREAIEWAKAMSFYTDSYQFHAAAISALEFAQACSTPEQENKILSEQQLSAYTVATTNARHRRDELPNSALHAAERNSVTAHLEASLLPVVEHYISQTKVSGVARDHAMRTIYEFDDLEGMDNQLRQSAYELLMRSSHFRDRRFFQTEVLAEQTIKDRKEAFKTSSYRVGGLNVSRPPRAQRPQPRT